MSIFDCPCLRKIWKHYERCPNCEEILENGLCRYCVNYSLSEKKLCKIKKWIAKSSVYFNTSLMDYGKLFNLTGLCGVNNLKELFSNVFTACMNEKDICLYFIEIEKDHWILCLVQLRKVYLICPKNEIKTYLMDRIISDFDDNFTKITFILVNLYSERYSTIISCILLAIGVMSDLSNVENSVRNSVIFWENNPKMVIPLNYEMEKVSTYNRDERIDELHETMKKELDAINIDVETDFLKLFPKLTVIDNLCCARSFAYIVMFLDFYITNRIPEDNFVSEFEKKRKYPLMKTVTKSYLREFTKNIFKDFKQWFMKCEHHIDNYILMQSIMEKVSEITIPEDYTFVLTKGFYLAFVEKPSLDLLESDGSMELLSFVQYNKKYTTYVKYGGEWYNMEKRKKVGNGVIKEKIMNAEYIFMEVK